MKIIFYCQHVLGVGHFFRSLEICRALAGHEVTLVTGGPRFEVTLPGHVRDHVSGYAAFLTGCFSGSGNRS